MKVLRKKPERHVLFKDNDSWSYYSPGQSWESGNSQVCAIYLLLYIWLPGKKQMLIKAGLWEANKTANKTEKFLWLRQTVFTQVVSKHFPEHSQQIRILLRDRIFPATATKLLQCK